eukprot:TRINITY_DN11179_c0_g1_i1.p1 TRINITY_DN11179_c0_g1~~TRINITY_DN11179_c0_g1_i1.p1  ORF type:complete len:188 (+),score=9.22 TRINITY_DN11179_c0_g1_i1:210-773(+)
MGPRSLRSESDYFEGFSGSMRRAKESSSGSAYGHANVVLGRQNTGVDAEPYLSELESFDGTFLRAMRTQQLVRLFLDTLKQAKVHSRTSMRTYLPAEFLVLIPHVHPEPTKVAKAAHVGWKARAFARERWRHQKAGRYLKRAWRRVSQKCALNEHRRSLARGLLRCAASESWELSLVCQRAGSSSNT